jgi:hypothetical protein
MCSVPLFCPLDNIFKKVLSPVESSRPSSVGISFLPFRSSNHVSRTTFSPSSCPPNNFCVGPSYSSDHLCVNGPVPPIQSSLVLLCKAFLSCPLIVLCKAVPSSCLGHTLPPTHPTIVRYSFGTYQRGRGDH